MLRLYPTTVSQSTICPYFPDRPSRIEFFYAADLTKEEAEAHLSQGWRCFGLHYFRPVCDCLACVSIRVPVQKFISSKSQRRVLRKNTDVEVKTGPLRYSDEVLDIYNEHSMTRFGKERESEEEFIAHFYTTSGPSAQSEFRIGGKLAGVGFLNLSEKGISSVYFVYRSGLEARSFGIFSMLAEIGIAKREGLEFYYPGYWIKEHPKMNYKGSLRPKQLYDRDTGLWHDEPETADDHA